MVVAVVSAEHSEDNLRYLELESVLDKSFDVVWAFGEAVPKNSISFTLSGTSQSGVLTMSGQCDYTADYNIGSGSKMDTMLNGQYTQCQNARVKDSIDHWKSNKLVNNAQLYTLCAAAFGSSWCMIGDKDHAANRINPLVGQHVLDHPRFLNKEYANHVENNRSTP